MVTISVVVKIQFKLSLNVVACDDDLKGEGESFCSGKRDFRVFHLLVSLGAKEIQGKRAYLTPPSPSFRKMIKLFHAFSSYVALKCLEVQKAWRVTVKSNLQRQYLNFTILHDFLLLFNWYLEPSPGLLA